MKIGIMIGILIGKKLGVLGEEWIEIKKGIEEKKMGERWVKI